MSIKALPHTEPLQLILIVDLTRKKMAGRLIVLVGLCTVVVHVPGTAGGCPKLTPVGLDENWFFSSQPSGGFYPIAAAGIDSVPKNNPKPMKVIKGSKKVCGKTKALLNGEELVAVPAIECTYETPGQYYCPTGAGAQAAASAMKAAGFFMPSAFTNTVVDTDNKTFVAIGSCMDGNIYEWSIYSPQKGIKKIHGSTLKALHINEKEVKGASKKKFSTGRAEFTKGACKKSGMGKVAEGLGGLFGGG